MKSNYLELIKSGDILSREQHLSCMRDYHDINTDWSEKYFLRPSELGESSYGLLAKSIGTSHVDGFKVLDLGCGIGTFYRQLDPEIRDSISYFGIDISEQSIKAAENSFAKGKRVFQVGSADNLPFPNENFDTVVSHMAFTMFKPIFNATREAFRVLKRSGIFAVVFPAVWSRCRNPNVDLDSGLREIVKDIYPNYGKNFGGFGEREFFSREAIETFLKNFPEVTLDSIEEFEVDFSGKVHEVLWGIKTFYWYQILDVEEKMNVEKRLIELLSRLQNSEGIIQNSRKLAMLKCSKV